MYREILEQWTDMGKNAMGPMIALNGISTHCFERIARQNMENINNCISTSMEQFKKLANSKNINDWAEVQAEMNTQCMGYTEKSMKAFTEAMTEAANEFNRVMKEGVSQFAKGAAAKPFAKKAVEKV